MFFDGEEGEGDFGPPPGKSKLSSLFGMDRASNQGGNESLTYTAPKQPKKGGKTPKEGAAQSSSGGGQSALLLAVAVHAYRFSNGTYIKHGKLGAAILGNHTANDYKLLLYISKQQQVTHARITPHFIFTTQANNYATFYDEQRQNWSIMFESEQNAVDFAKQVGLSKLNASGGITKGVIQQDLIVGMGEPVSEGDSVEVKYTGWLYQSRAFGSVFDSNATVDKAFRFKIGRGKVIKGWEEGVISMKKGGRRLLLIPPALAYGKKGLGSRIPANSTLIFDVEIKKIKVSKDETGSVSSDAMEAASALANEHHRAASPRVDGASSSDEEEKMPTPSSASHSKPPVPRKISTNERVREKRSPSATSLTKPTKPNRKVSSDETVKTRSASITEQLSTSPVTSSKAKLISRMAKMGQPMLPLQGAAVAESTDDSEVDENSASDTGYTSPPPVTTHTHPRSKPAKTVRKPPTSVKPEHQHVPVADHMTQQAGMQMHIQNSTPGMMPQNTQAMPHSHAVAVYHPQQQQPQQQQHQFQAQPQVQQQPMTMPGMAGMQGMQGMAQQPGFQQYPTQTTDPNLLLQQQQQAAAAVAAAQQTLHQQQQQQQQAFGGALLTGTSQALVQQPLSKELPVLLSESRQHHSDLKMVMDLVSGKIDNLSSRVEKLNFQSSASGQSSAAVPNLEANILMQNIARIVQENEKLKKENVEKGSKIESQNEKIAELIQRNQMFVEQSNTMMEKRNDSFKQTTAQSQARVLEMEQEKVQLTADLSKATAKISALQMELSAVQQREGELKSQLNLGINTSQSQLTEMEAMRAKQQESDWKVTELTRNLKEEKAEKKSLSNRLMVIEDELNDLKSEKENIDKNLSERKKKAAHEKQRFDEEMEEFKKQYEEEISSLQNKLRLQKSTKDIATAEQVAQVERDLEAQWRERSERLLAQATDKHDRLYNELIDEKDALAKKLAQTEQKMIALRSGQGEIREEASQLKEQLSEMSGWKEKYDGLHSNALSMKERYEERIKELIQDKETRDGAASQSNIIDEVKKIMNSVYHTLRSEFEPGGNYKGADILNTIMNTIKLVTLKLVKRSTGGSTEEEEEEEEDEEEEEEEEEEEDSEEEEEDDTEEENEEEEQTPVHQAKESPEKRTPPVKEAAQASAPPSATPSSPPPSDPPSTQPPSIPAPAPDEPEDIPDLPDVPTVEPHVEESDSEEDENEDDKNDEKNIPEEDGAEVATATKEAEPEDDQDEGDAVTTETEPSPPPRQPEDEEDVYGPTSLPPKMPPEAPPELPPSDEDGEENKEEEVEENKEEEEEENKEEDGEEDKETEEKTADQDEEQATEVKAEVPDMPPQDTMDDLPDFTPQDEATPDDTTPETAPPPAASPPPFLPSLPPELPPEDEEEPKAKSAMDDIFGDDDDDEDEFFSTPPTKRKELIKKTSTTKPTDKKEAKEAEFGDSLKLNAPPPLFGSDDDDDDLDWLTSKK